MAEGKLDNQHLYNDKELIEEAELGWHDYGFRNYDPQIGRFPQLDPLTFEYPFLTPYQYASCDPITNIDIDGLEGLIANGANATGEALRKASIITVNVSKKAAQGTSLLGTIGNGVSLANSGFTAIRQVKDNICSQCQTLNMNLKPKPIEREILKNDGLGTTYIGKESDVRAQVFYARDETVGESVRNGFFGATGYTFFGDKGAIALSYIDVAAAAHIAIERPGTLNEPMFGRPSYPTTTLRNAKPPLRIAYETEVRGLSYTANVMRSQGLSSEVIARTLHKLRRDLGVKYKALTPNNLLQEIYERNLEKYGDKLGPSIEYYRAKGNSWDDIINSSIRPGGNDINFNK